MNLYELTASNFEGFYGKPEEPTGVDAITIAQKPDCSSFLVLSTNDSPFLRKCDTIPDGYDFTYCQEWGLDVTEEMIFKVKQDLVKRFPNKWPEMEKAIHNARMKALRKAAYRERSDVLYFKAMRGELTIDEANAEVEKIKEEYPYVE